MNRQTAQPHSWGRMQKHYTADRSLWTIQIALLFFGTLISLISLNDVEGFSSTADRVKAFTIGIGVVAAGLLGALRPLRAWLRNDVHWLVTRVLALVSVWLVLFSIALAGVEIYTRSILQNELWSWSLKKKNPSTFVPMYLVTTWNRRAYDSNRAFFQNWPAPPDLYDSDDPYPFSLFKPNERRRVTSDGQLVPAKPGEDVYWSSNSYGFRGPEFSIRKSPGVIRIVCLGASTTVGMQRDDETYPHYLQLALNRLMPTQPIEVINAGHYGYAVEDSLALLKQKVLPLKPDILIFYEANNNIDLQDYLSGLTCPLDSCWLETYPGWYRWLHQHSALFTVFARKLNLDNRLPPPMPHIFNDSPTRLPSEARYEKGLRGIVAAAQAQGITVVLSSFVSIAHDGLQLSYQDAPDIFDMLYKHLYPVTPGEWARIYQRLNQISASVAHDFDAPYVDVAANFPQEVRYFAFDYYHLSPEGNQLLATAFADYLAKRVLPAMTKAQAVL